MWLLRAQDLESLASDWHVAGASSTQEVRLPDQPQPSLGAAPPPFLSHDGPILYSLSLASLHQEPLPTLDKKLNVFSIRSRNRLIFISCYNLICCCSCRTLNKLIKDSLNLCFLNKTAWFQSCLLRALRPGFLFSSVSLLYFIKYLRFPQKQGGGVAW